MNYLVDTNVVSEMMKKAPDSTVLAWLLQNEEACFLSSVTVGEIERGVELLSSGRKKRHLKELFNEFLLSMEERVLNFDLEVAHRWAILTAEAQRNGRVMPVLDSMIAATALHWKLTVVTRNTSDFSQVPKINPWLPTV